MNDKTCPIPEPFKAMIGNVVFLTLIFFFTFISRFIFAPLMPTIVKNLALSPAQAGSIFLIGSFGYLIGAFSSGFVSSRIHHRGALIVAALGAGLALLVCALMPSLRIIRMTMLVLGVAAGLNLPSNIATVTAIVSPQDWGKALAVQQMAPPLSLVLGPLISVALLTWFSWRIPLVCVAIFSLAVGLAFIRFCKCGDFPGEAPSIPLLKVVLAHKSFWIMVLLLAFGMGGQVGIYAMLPLYLVTERGLPGELANTLIGLSQISALFMTFFSGWVTDRIGEKRAIALFLSSSGVLTVLLGVLSGTWLRVVVFLQPALIVCFFPAAFAALSRIVQPHMRSLAAAFVPPMAFILGGGLFPAVLGYMGEDYTFGLGITLAGCMIILGSIVVHFLKLLEKMEDGC